MRATRDLRRRRLDLTRKRAALLPPGQHTNRQSNLPESGKKMAYKANRDGVAARCPAPAVPKRLAVDRTLIDSYDQLLRELALHRVPAATPHRANPLSLRRPVPGIGNILSPVVRDELHDIRRCPRGQAFVSYCRVVKWAKASAGTRDGGSGTKSGKASLKWGVSEAAVLCLRHTPAGQKSLARVEKNQGKGKAVTILAHRWARALYSLVQRGTAFDLDTFLPD
jgi:transposase